MYICGDYDGLSIFSSPVLHQRTVTQSLITGSHPFYHQVPPALHTQLRSSHSVTEKGSRGYMEQPESFKLGTIFDN